MKGGDRVIAFAKLISVSFLITLFPHGLCWPVLGRQDVHVSLCAMQT